MAGELLNVQVVSSPDWIVIPVTARLAALKLPVAVLSALVHEALVRFHPLTAASVTDPVLVKPSGRLPELLEPVMLTGFPPLGVGTTVKLKTWLVVPATLTIFRKPLPGLTMQSNGLLLPPLPADGYEQTLTRLPPPTSDLRTVMAMVVSCGLLWPAGNGSVSVWRFGEMVLPGRMPAVI